VVGFMIDLSGSNYRIMFVFASVFMALAGVFMLRVKEQRTALAEASGELGRVEA